MVWSKIGSSFRIIFFFKLSRRRLRDVDGTRDEMEKKNGRNNNKERRRIGRNENQVRRNGSGSTFRRRRRRPAPAADRRRRDASVCCGSRAPSSARRRLCSRSRSSSLSLSRSRRPVSWPPRDQQPRNATRKQPKNTKKQNTTARAPSPDASFLLISVLFLLLVFYVVVVFFFSLSLRPPKNCPPPFATVRGPPFTENVGVQWPYRICSGASSCFVVLLLCRPFFFGCRETKARRHHCRCDGRLHTKKKELPPPHGLFSFFNDSGTAPWNFRFAHRPLTTVTKSVATLHVQIVACWPCIAVGRHFDSLSSVPILPGLSPCHSRHKDKHTATPVNLEPQKSQFLLNNIIACWEPIRMGFFACLGIRCVVRAKIFLGCQSTWQHSSESTNAFLVHWSKVTSLSLSSQWTWIDLLPAHPVFACSLRRSFSAVPLVQCVSRTELIDPNHRKRHQILSKCLLRSEQGSVACHQLNQRYVRSRLLLAANSFWCRWQRRQRRTSFVTFSFYPSQKPMLDVDTLYIIPCI